MAADGLFLGIDIGTGGVRATVIEAGGAILGEARAPLPPPETDGPAVRQNPDLWWDATRAALRALAAEVSFADIRAVAVDGTSGTVLLVDADGRPQTPGALYNDAAAVAEAEKIAACAPAQTGAIGATSGLAKGLRLWRDHGRPGLRLLHQADWIRGRLDGEFGLSDENNALKTGYDPVAREWPAWIDALDLPRAALPEAPPAGTPVGRATTQDARALGLPPDVLTVSGTTDGCASFLATGAVELGDAVTALGTTLTVKLLSDTPAFDPEAGVYSHRLGGRWLVGGASNSGGAALAAHFSADRIAALSLAIDPETPSGFDYYPLPRRGERFPINDPTLEPRLSPRPDDDALFLKALLEGVAAVERLAYQRLGRPRRVLTVGGGARNDAWTRIRGRVLGLPVAPAAQVEAAYGTALLARRAVS